VTAEHFDVLIVGAGLSGICAAYYLHQECPGQSVAILEARDAIGGTWDLFRFPGIRSDSDLYTFGFSFRPWRDERAMASGASILRYLHETAEAFNIDDKIRLSQRVTRAAWDSKTALWNVDAAVSKGPEPIRYTCAFLYLCTGYYDYAEGYMPGWPGMARFRGTVVHPQHWPAYVDYAGKRVVVIGSGSTAVTLIPPLAQDAAHVTMLQRSPGYVVTLPARDRVVQWMRRRFPERVAHALARWKNVIVSMLFYNLARRQPNFTKRLIARAAKAQLGPDFDIDPHFTPRYNPWDQRVCFVPDGDLFCALRSGKAAIVTGEIEAFTDSGIRLKSGENLDADIVVTATGLNMRFLGGIDLVVDGQTIDISKHFLYKGMMLSDVPNSAYSIGYTNASWTLKCELIARYVCRLLNHMDAREYTIAVPRVRGTLGDEPAVALTSGYVQRSLSSLPKQGSRRPWKLYQNYALDMLAFRFGSLEDGTMTFIRPGE
jgi:monooxygenase